jgi:hypothetical protein
MFLEELVAVVAGEEASSLTGKAGEPGYTQPVERERGSDRRTGIQWQEAASRGEMPAREVIAASILASKSRKAGRLTSSSETRARNPTRAEMQWRRSGSVDQLGRRRMAGIGREALEVIVAASR